MVSDSKFEVAVGSGGDKEVATAMSTASMPAA